MSKIEINKLVFLSFFSIWLLLILLLGDTFLSIYFYLIFVLFFIFFGRKFLKLALINKKIIFTILTLLGLLISNLFFSLNRGSTLDGIISYIVAIIVFYVIFLLKNRFFASKDFFLLLSLVSPVLMLLNLFYLFFPKFGVELLSKNILYATYGHNHFAGFLLLVLPMFVFTFFHKKRVEYFLLSFFGSLFILLSFSRLAIFFFLLELVFLFVFINQKKFSELIKKYDRVLAFSVTALLLAAIFIKSTVFFQKLTRPLSYTERLAYWKQSIQSFKQYPLFGIGLNNFYLASLKYRQLPWFYSAYAHNFFLNQLVELGLPATLVFHTLVLLILVNFKKAFKSKEPLVKPIYIGLLISYLYSFFDYDWNFNGIFILSMFFMVFLAKNFYKTDRVRSNKKMLLQQLVILILNYFLIITGCLYLLINILVARGSVDQAFDVFPYFIWHKLVFLESEQLTQPQQQHLALIYSNDADFLLKKIKQNPSQKEVVKEKQTLFYLNPYAGLFYNNLDYYFMNKDWLSFKLELDKISQFLMKAIANNGFDVKYIYKQQLAEQIYAYAVYLYNQQSYQSAASYFKLAWQFDNWIFDHQPKFIDLNQPISRDQEDLVLQLADIKPKYFSNQLPLLTELAYRLLLFKVDQADWVNMGLLINQTINYLDFYQWKIWNTVLPTVVEQATDDCKQQPDLCLTYTKEFKQIIQQPYFVNNSWSNKQKLIQFYQLAVIQNLEQLPKKKIIELLAVMQIIDSDEYWSQVQMANFYVSVGEINKAKKAYKNCLLKFNNEHNDCKYGLQDLKDEKINDKKFKEIAKIILDGD